MHHITLTFTPTNGILDGRYIHMKGLHGLLFTVLKQADPAGAAWLHDHESPKPFSMVPLFDAQGNLAGVRYATMNQRTTELLLLAWQMVFNRQEILRLGRYQTFQVTYIESTAGPSFHELATLPLVWKMQLQFLSPTAFKQGPCSLPLPLPFNVFNGPFRVWQAYVPAPLSEDWLEWCQQELFIMDHTIETATTAITQEERFTGFVGAVTFFAHAATDEHLRIWHALAHLATFCGVGHKTTMGMGAVELIYTT